MAEAGFFLSPARVFARPTADPIWLGPAQRAALSQLSREARIRLLVGTPSSGKSTLLNHVARQLGSDSVVLQNGLGDLLHVDTVAAHLNLLVATSHKVDRAIERKLAKIAGAV